MCNRDSDSWEIRQRWEENVKAEIHFWDMYFHYHGLRWNFDYRRRLDPDLQLQNRPAELLKEKNSSILDVGSGPLTYLGKKLGERDVSIIAVDPLADEYEAILKKYGIISLVRTIRLEAENLTDTFCPDTFDLVYTRNCIDHTYNPERAILQMISVVKRNSYVLMEHKPNEGENENYQGLHQWNFSMNSDGEFTIASKKSSINFTRKYSSISKINCEMIYEEGEGDMLITRVVKK